MGESKSWREFLRRYEEYRSLPVWGTMTRMPDGKGRLSRLHLLAIAERGKRAVARVAKVTACLEESMGTSWPVAPAGLYARWNRIPSKVRLRLEAELTSGMPWSSTVTATPANTAEETRSSSLRSRGERERSG